MIFSTFYFELLEHLKNKQIPRNFRSLKTVCTCPEMICIAIFIVTMMLSQSHIINKKYVVKYLLTMKITLKLD